MSDQTEGDICKVVIDRRRSEEDDILSRCQDLWMQHLHSVRGEHKRPRTDKHVQRKRAADRDGERAWLSRRRVAIGKASSAAPGLDSPAVPALHADHKKELAFQDSKLEGLKIQALGLGSLLPHEITADLANKADAQAAKQKQAVESRARRAKQQEDRWVGGRASGRATSPGPRGYLARRVCRRVLPGVHFVSIEPVSRSAFCNMLKYRLPGVPTPKASVKAYT